MSTEAFQRIVPNSSVRYRPLKARTEAIPIITPRTSRRNLKRLPRMADGPSCLATQAAQAVQRYCARAHWMLPVGLTMTALVALLWVGQFFWSWAAITYDDLRYGRPRTFQTDQVVGHADSPEHPSHFIAFNLRGQVEILELPGGDSAHARIIVGPQLSSEHDALVPVTLQFTRAKGSRLPDLLVEFGGIEVRYKNENGIFTPQ